MNIYSPSEKQEEERMIAVSSQAGNQNNIFTVLSKELKKHNSEKDIYIYNTD